MVTFRATPIRSVFQMADRVGNTVGALAGFAGRCGCARRCAPRCKPCQWIAGEVGFLARCGSDGGTGGKATATPTLANGIEIRGGAGSTPAPPNALRRARGCSGGSRGGVVTPSDGVRRHVAKSYRPCSGDLKWLGACRLLVGGRRANGYTYVRSRTASCTSPAACVSPAHTQACSAPCTGQPRIEPASCTHAYSTLGE